MKLLSIFHRRLGLFAGLALAAGTAAASIISSPNFNAIAVWVGGSGADATSVSYVNTASMGQPISGAVPSSPSFRMMGGFIEQFPQSSPAFTTTQMMPAGGGGTLTLNPPEGPVTVTFAAGSFDLGVTVTVLVPGSFPNPRSNIADLLGTSIGVDISNDLNRQPQRAMAMTFHYRNTDIAGMNESRLRVAYYLADEDRWVPLKSVIDADGNSISASWNRMGVYRVMEVLPAAAPGQAFVFPNPFRPSNGHTEMRFSRLPENAPLRIYTLAGEWVCDLRADVTGETSWDGRNADGRPVSSGVYLGLVRRGSEHETLRLAVER